MEFIRTKKSSLSLDLAPMIDIVFQLLIFFMLTSSFLTPMAMKLTLPQAVTQDQRDREQIIISIDKHQKIFINTQEVTSTNFGASLQESFKKTSKKSVHLRGDQDMPYHFFVQVMDMARQAGAQQINIMHEGKNR